MDDAENEIQTRQRLASKIRKFFHSKKVDLSISDAEISALQISTGFNRGMKHNSVWDSKKENQKLDDIIYHINSFKEIFDSLHPDVLEKIEFEYSKILDEYIFNRFDRNRWPFDNTFKEVPDDNYIWNQKKKIYATNIANHISMHFAGVPFGNGAINKAIENTRPEIDVNEGKSSKKWKRINLVNAARIVWQKHLGQEAPRSLASGHESDFEDFLQLVFDTLGIDTKPETLRAAMDSWRKANLM